MGVTGNKCNEISLKHLKFGIGEEGEIFSKSTWPSDENTCDNRKRQDSAIYRELYLISLDPLEKP